MNSRCLVLYSFEHDRNKSLSLFDFVNKYFAEQLLCEFRYAGFYDESYRDKYGKIATVKPKIENTKPDRIVNFTLDSEDIKSKKRTVSVEFNVSRPIILTVVIPVETTFDFEKFSVQVIPFFKITYGFSYIVDNYSWPTAYAFGDWQHVNGVQYIDRLSKPDLQRWSANCEKISEGYLRDVYHENILRSGHLANKIDGIALDDIIKRNNAGVVMPLGADMFFWKLNEQELQSIKKVLKGSNIFI